MKKSIILLLIVLFCVSMTACTEEQKSVSEYCTVTFTQSGQPDIVKTVEKGKPLTDIPQPVAISGYEVVWDPWNFAAITKNITVTAIATAKTYTITYNLGTQKDDGYAKLKKNTQQVVFNSEYSLEQPTCYGYKFKGWKIAGTEIELKSGIYQRTENIELVAIWEEDSESNRWWSDWY